MTEEGAALLDERLTLAETTFRDPSLTPRSMRFTKGPDGSLLVEVVSPSGTPLRWAVLGPTEVRALVTFLSRSAFGW